MAPLAKRSALILLCRDAQVKGHLVGDRSSGPLEPGGSIWHPQLIHSSSGGGGEETLPGLKCTGADAQCEENPALITAVVQLAEALALHSLTTSVTAHPHSANLSMLAHIIAYLSTIVLPSGVLTGNTSSRHCLRSYW